MKKNLRIIINPASGKEEPVLSILNQGLDRSLYNWEISVTQKNGDAYRFTLDALTKHADAVVVYGGDGTVMEAAQALFKTEIPLLVLPGGTANVMAAELGIPFDTKAALKLIEPHNYQVKKIDMGIIGHKPFVLRINMGIFADMIIDTDQFSKIRLGQFAYSLTAIKNVFKHHIFKYRIELDGKVVKASGIGLMVANIGSLGISNFSVSPQIMVDDGLLDVIVLEKAQLSSVVTWMKSAMTHIPAKTDILHFQAKKIKIMATPQHWLIADDKPFNPKAIDVQVVPKALTVITP